jgi:hypothetical protein
MTILLCDYGCNNIAHYTFKSGKHCCNNSTSKCPALKSANSEKVKKVRQQLGDQFWKNGHPKGSKNGTSLKGKTYEDIYGENAQKQKEIRNNLGPSSWSKISDERKQELREKQSQRIIQRYENGWMPKAGRCKKIRYNSPIAGEVLLDGTWELEAAMYFDWRKFNWKRNTKRFSYTNLKGTISFYTPDFYVEELGGYLEVKGYETELDRCKWKQFEYQLTIWKKSNILNIKLERGQDGNAAVC